MNVLTQEEEAIPLVSNDGSRTSVRDTRKPYQQQLAVNFILTSLLFERIAFYSTAANLFMSLTPLKWQYFNAFIASLIFSSKYY
jgi:hypothetical protein